MAYEILISEAAEHDVLQAIEWYRDKKIGLDSEFQSELISKIKVISNRPYLFSEKYKLVRVAFLKRFPYGIHFKVDRSKNQLVVIGIFHTSENPKKWKGRM